jgi:hypothetical protein
MPANDSIRIITTVIIDNEQFPLDLVRDLEPTHFGQGLVEKF